MNRNWNAPSITQPFCFCFFDFERFSLFLVLFSIRSKFSLILIWVYSV
ncbi:unnamed protein product, partial [Vitis vinifera]